MHLAAVSYWQFPISLSHQAPLLLAYLKYVGPTTQLARLAAHLVTCRAASVLASSILTPRQPSWAKGACACIHQTSGPTTDSTSCMPTVP